MIKSVKQWVVKNHQLNDALFIEQLPFRSNKTTEVQNADLSLFEDGLVGFHFIASVEKKQLDRWLKTEQYHLEVFDEVWLCITPPMLTNAIVKADPTVGLLVVDKKGKVVRARYPNGSEKIERAAIIQIFNQEVDLPTDPKLKTTTKNNLIQQQVRQAFNAPPTHRYL